jgi:hypothetical protein
MPGGLRKKFGERANMPGEPLAGVSTGRVEDFQARKMDSAALTG